MNKLIPTSTLLLLVLTASAAALEITPAGLPNGLRQAEVLYKPWIVQNGTWRSATGMPTYSATSQAKLLGPFGPGAITIDMSISTDDDNFQVRGDSTTLIATASTSKTISAKLSQKFSSLSFQYVKNNSASYYNYSSDYVSIQSLTLPVADTLHLEGREGGSYVFYLTGAESWVEAASNSPQMEVTLAGDSLVWTPSQEGSYAGEIRSASGDSSVVLILDVIRNIPPAIGKRLIHFENDNDTLVGRYTTRSQASSHTGTTALMMDWSKSLTGRQLAPTCSLTVTSDSGMVSFWVNTINNGDQNVCFWIDDSSKQCWGSSQSWTKYSFPITAGPHQLKWQGNIPSFGFMPSSSDRDYVDDVVIPGYQGGSDSLTLRTGLSRSVALPVSDDWVEGLTYTLDASSPFEISGSTLLRKQPGAADSSYHRLVVKDLALASDTLWVRFVATEDHPPVPASNPVTLVVPLGDSLDYLDTLFTFSELDSQEVSVSSVDCPIDVTSYNSSDEPDGWVYPAWTTYEPTQADTVNCTVTLEDGLNTVDVTLRLETPALSPILMRHQQKVWSYSTRDGALEIFTSQDKPYGVQVLGVNGRQLLHAEATGNFLWRTDYRGVLLVRITDADGAVAQERLLLP